MTDPTQPSVEPVRLLLDFGESVELDGSMLYDPVAEGPVPAVVLRMPRHRAAWFGLVLDAYTQVSQLVGTDVVAAERGPAWALDLAARSAGHVDPARPASVHGVTSGHRLAASAVLRSAQSLDDTTTIAVVDAVAGWLDEPGGEEYAYALLGAVTDGQTQRRAYGQLLGRDP
jgi:hypothetical protein